MKEWLRNSVELFGIY